MNRTRLKSIAALLGTLVIGILLGLLIPPTFHRLAKRDHAQVNQNRGNPMQKNRWFVGTLERVIRPDSTQAAKIKPVTDWAAVRIDSIERTADTEMARVLDSVRTQLIPIITPEQQERLTNFTTRAHDRWGHGKGRRHH